GAVSPPGFGPCYSVIPVVGAIDYSQKSDAKLVRSQPGGEAPSAQHGGTREHASAATTAIPTGALKAIGRLMACRFPASIGSLIRFGMSDTADSDPFGAEPVSGRSASSQTVMPDPAKSPFFGQPATIPATTNSDDAVESMPAADEASDAENVPEEDPEIA